jgi:thymidylate kinase
MILEFYGLPGAGKTTVSQKIAESSDFKIIKVRSKRELFWYNFLFLIKHPIKFFVTLFYLFSNSTSWAVFYYKFTNTFLHHNAKYQKALQARNAILDQGYFQNILSVLEKPIGVEFFLEYSRFLLKPDKLIILNLPSEKIIERIGGRGYAAREIFGREYFNKWLEIVIVNNKTFLENLDKMGVEYKIINADRSTEEVCGEILNILQEK